MSTIVVNRKLFIKALKRAIKVAGKHPPALKNARLDCNGKFNVTTTNLEVTLEDSFQFISSDYQGSLCVQAKELEKIVSNASEQELTLDIADSLTVSGVSMAIESTDEFPGIDSIKDMDILSVWQGPASELAAMLAFCEPATDEELGRYALSSILMELHGEDDLACIATDGRRLHIAYQKDDATQKDISQDRFSLLHLSHAKLLIDACKKADWVVVELFGKKPETPESVASPAMIVVHVATGDTEYMKYKFRPVYGRYPNWRLIPKNTSLFATVDASAISTACDQVFKILHSDEECLYAHFNMTGESLAITGKSPSKSVMRDVLVNCVQEYNAKLDLMFVKDIHTAMSKSSKSVDWHCEGDTKKNPLVVKADKRLCVLMIADY